VALAVWALEHEFRGLSWGMVLAELRALPLERLAAAFGFTLLSYALLTVFDWQGLRALGRRVSPLRLAGTAFAANALGHSLGLAPLTAGSVRLKGYGDAGLGLADVGRIVLQASVGFALGAWTLTGLTLLFAPAQVASLLPGTPWGWRGVGLLILCTVTGLLWRLRREPSALTIGRFSIKLPSRTEGIVALVVSVLELAAVAAALYVLLPSPTASGFLEFLSSFAVALLAGVLSTVPAGIGTFDWCLIVLLPEVPKHSLLAAIVAFRLIYYALPLLLGLVVLLLLVAGEPVRRLTGRAAALVPVTAAVAVFTVGASLVLVGSLPIPPREAIAAPLPLLELSHFFGSLLGLLLIVLAEGIRRRSRGAWGLSLGGLLLGAAFAFARHDPPALVLSLLAIAAVLAIARAHFTRPAAVFEVRFRPFWWRNVALVVLGSLWLLLFAYRHVPYQNELWWQFALSADAPRALRALLAIIVVLAVLGLWQLLRPAPHREALPTAADLDDLQPVIAAAAAPSAHLALLGDKALLPSTDRHGFVMYRQSGNSLIAMGDPVGAEHHRKELRWAFRELADQRDLRCVFYQVGQDELDAYLDLGLALVKLGEEAVVELEKFTLEGKAAAELRQARNRGLREGLRFDYVVPDAVDAWLPRLQAVSDDWLATKAGREKGFSLGYFSADYLRRCPLAVVLQEERVLAFANLWVARTSGEVQLDLMRQSRDAPRGVMDFLFVELLLWSQREGHRQFNLGMAPLAGMARHRLAARSQRLLGYAAGHGERFYGFEGLRRYKSKFNPVWHPRYLAAPGGLQLPGVFLDLTRLIGSGPPR
jgi:phosphatidylglycerol lysyltransferase